MRFQVSSWRAFAPPSRPARFGGSGATSQVKPQQGAQPRCERGREVMEPDACESATGRGTNGAPALVTRPRFFQRSGGVEGHAAARARAYSKAIPIALDIIPSKRPEGVPPGGTQSLGSRAAGVEPGPLHHQRAVARHADAGCLLTIGCGVSHLSTRQLSSRFCSGRSQPCTAHHHGSAHA